MVDVWNPTREEQVAMEVSRLWERKSVAYYQDERDKRFEFPVSPNHSLWPIALRVARDCISSGVEPDLYVGAQFYYFHKWFGRSPKFGELCSSKSKVSAIARATMFSRMPERIRAVPVVRSFRTCRRKAQPIAKAMERLGMIADAMGLPLAEAFERVYQGNVLSPELVQAVLSGEVSL